MKNRYLQNTSKIQCFKSSIVSINGGSRIYFMFSENLSTAYRYFGHLMAYFIFVQFVQTPILYMSSSMAHALFFQPLQNLVLSSKQRHYHSSKFICIIACHLLCLVCPNFFQTQQIH